MRSGTTRRYRVTLLGLGAMGQRHARILRGLAQRFELVGTYDPNPAAATPDGAVRFSSETEAIGRADIVLIATPIETHAGLVACALASGRHAFVEKPICSTAAEARSAVASARAGARLFVGHSERFNPVVRMLAKLVRDDAVLAIDLRRVGPSKPCVSCVLVNVGVHDFDLAAYLSGAEVILRGAIGVGDGGGGQQGAAHVIFSTAGGATGHLYVDRTSPAKERAIEVSTPRWVYRGDLLAHRLVRIARSGAARVDVSLPLAEPLEAQAVALADALDGEFVREIAVADDGIRALDLAEQAGALCAWGAGSGAAENLSIDRRR